MTVVYKIWDKKELIYRDRGKPQTDWYPTLQGAQTYVRVMVKAWHLADEYPDRFEIHRYKLSMTRLKDDNTKYTT